MILESSEEKKKKNKLELPHAADPAPTQTNASRRSRTTRHRPKLPTVPDEYGLPSAFNPGRDWTDRPLRKH
ncbi:hypothetical protein MA16_Dca002148 [Dendrobium catenatum]|uniref:Uncharacterized protein n=1 Tax=Dendrobium catenatum TaxID=906689 RepID=A0A2I0XEF9_9ASPA|nr:hypothetical protein MA16_Dca002148 [Dendrobium catenatum]